uniref:Putative secreted mucin n=1 Tax=Desmodus rotundus TaxID=9430 RepID=K9IHN7_DESRO
MTGAPLVLLLLLALCPGSNSQAVVTQEPFLTVSPGGTVTLTCGHNTGAVTSEHYPSWFQQKSGRAPTTLIYDIDKKSGWTPARFSGSIVGGKGALTLSGAQPEDEADYYCWLVYSGARVFGGGTQLTVLSQPKSAPTVTLFPPSTEELSNNKATLVCLMSDFYPGAVTVAWKENGSPVSQGVETTKPSKQSNNKYVASSYLSMSASKWKSASQYSCHVTHDGNTVEKTVVPSECS